MKTCEGPFGKCGKVAKFTYSAFDRLAKKAVKGNVCEDCKKKMEAKAKNG